MDMRTKLLKYISVIILITLLNVAILGGCGNKVVQTQQEVKNVRAITAGNFSININVEYAGKVKPIEEVTVSSKIPGKVSSIKADVGTEVQKGQVLFTLEEDSAKSQLKQAQAAVDSARANLARTGDSSLSQQILQAETAVNQAQIMYSDAKSFYEKAQNLYGQGAIPKQQLDDAESRFKNAGIQLNTARDNLKLLKDKSGPQTVDVAAAQLTQAQAASDIAVIQLNDTTVVSPIDGVVSIRNIDEGEIASGSIPAFTIINTKTIVVEVSIPDRMVGNIKKGEGIPVKINALGEKAFKGVVDSISPSADSRTQAYIVRLKIENPDNTVKSGMLARVALPLESKQNVLTVPNEAIVVESGVQYVYAVVEGKIKKKTVSLGLSNDKITEITKGLNAGDYVITEGQNFLNDGESVNIVK